MGGSIGQMGWLSGRLQSLSLKIPVPGLGVVKDPLTGDQSDGT